jgi:hypothetical protein
MPRYFATALALAVAGLTAIPAAAATILSPRAQRLVEQTITANPDMLDIIIHITPPHATQNIVVAAHLQHALGEASGDDDIGVMRTGKPLVEVQKDGVRIGVLVQLRDATGHAIGAVGLMYPYRAGADQAAFLKRSQALRDRMAHAIPSRGALFAGPHLG